MDAREYKQLFIRRVETGGPVNQVLRRRELRYLRRVGEPYATYSPFDRTDRTCDCRHTYGYPDEVVLALDDERCRLGRANERMRRQLEEIQSTARNFEWRLREEEARTDALRRQLQDTHQYLFALKRQLRERALSVRGDCDNLLDLAAEAPPRASGAVPMDEIDTIGSVGDWAP